MGLMKKWFGRRVDRLYAPMAGKVIALAQMPDPAFAEGMLGSGVAIEPAEGRVYAPCDAVVDTMFAGSAPCDGTILTNARQFDAIRRAYEAMLRSMQGLKLGLTPDAVLTDVEEAMNAMGEVTGATIREDITARIFERFCVGK